MTDLNTTTDWNRPLFPESVNDETVSQWAGFLRDQKCLICGGIEGCAHTVRERARATIAYRNALKEQTDE